MSIEQEAQDFVSGKKNAFKDGMELGCNDMTQYMKDNLYPSHELERAIDKLTEMELWALRAAEQYGIK
jgi:hypothetical protein